MVCLEKLDRSDFEEVYRIMEQSFPADERRKKEGQQKLLDEEKYELLGVRTVSYTHLTLPTTSRV